MKNFARRRPRTRVSRFLVLGAGTTLAIAAFALGANAEAQVAELDLETAVRQAVDADLNLAAQRQALDAEREEVAIARSALLPQIDLGAQGQILEEDRSDGSRGNVTKESATLQARLSQVLYDEADFANVEIQQYVYAAQEQQYAAFRLELIGEAAQAFLELDRARALLAVQERNRDITLRNTEASRARIAAGYSSETEILRWQSQLASDHSDIAATRARALASRFELNRIRNLPREASVTLRSATLEAYGFVYARPPIAAAVADPREDERLRDLMVRVGTERSPALAEASEAIAAAERQLLAKRRAFWVPSLALVAGVNHLAADSDTRDKLKKTEWGVGAQLSFPLLEGGAKFAGERQAEQYALSLRTQRRSVVITLGESVRAAFATASASYAILQFAGEQVAAARRYFELTDESYVLGMASILQLLDAQTQLLSAEEAATNAHYDFLEATLAAEQEIAFFPFLATDAEAQGLLDDVERQLASAP